MNDAHPTTVTCPVSVIDADVVQLAHGEGARLTRRLIRNELLSAFDNMALQPLGDAAVLGDLGGEAVFSTDGFVVTPLFFPGGDIGQLAVYGTVNDLAVAGAEPLFLSVGLIIEEGLPLATLRRVIASIADATRACGVIVAAGDTKVVPRGKADGLFITTTGVGRRRSGLRLDPSRVTAGDAVIVSGTLGDHGMAILAAREGFGFAGELRSDSAPLTPLVEGLIAAGVSVRWMRDLTRGGACSALHELVEAAGISIEIEETAVPVNPAVRGACEVLGLDPLYVANEGKLLAIVAAEHANAAVEALHRVPLGSQAAVIGRVLAGAPPQVWVKSAFGPLRSLDEPAGAPLPRIC